MFFSLRISCVLFDLTKKKQPVRSDSSASMSLLNRSTFFKYLFDVRAITEANW